MNTMILPHLLFGFSGYSDNLSTSCTAHGTETSSGKILWSSESPPLARGWSSVAPSRFPCYIFNTRIDVLKYHFFPIASRSEPILVPLLR
jgi:hypothetical protein